MVALMSVWVRRSRFFDGTVGPLTTDPNFEYGTCLAWFYDSFYQRLFAVHPSCRSLFKGGLQG